NYFSLSKSPSRHFCFEGQIYFPGLLRKRFVGALSCKSDSVKMHGVACKYLCQPFLDVTVGQLLFFVCVTVGRTMSKHEINKRSRHAGVMARFHHTLPDPHT